MPVPRTALLAGAIVALLVLVGCGGTDDTAGTVDTADAASDVASAPSAAAPDPDPQAGGQDNSGGNQGSEPEVAVPEALDFSATQVSGEGFDARELAGTDTVLWFWAPWCTECAAAAADIQATASATPDVTFVGVAGLSTDVDAMQGFIDQHGLGFTQLADTDGTLYTRFSVTQQDTFVLVDADGAVETVPAYGGATDLDALIADTFA